MKYKKNDIIKITLVQITSDINNEEITCLLGKEAKITDVQYAVPTYKGVYPNYQIAIRDGYRLSIGNPNLLWFEEELELVHHE